MSKLSNHKIQQCGECGKFTSDGRNIPSTNKNPVTGITEEANFICRHCDWERRNLSLVDKAADKRLKE